MEDQKRDIFISYTAKDRKWAEWIAWKLVAAKFTLFIQAWDFGAGNDFIEEMDGASRKARRTIAVISPDYFKSGFGAPEWTMADAEDPVGRKRKIIQVQVSAITLLPFNKQRLYSVDLCNQAL